VLATVEVVQAAAAHLVAVVHDLEPLGAAAPEAEASVVAAGGAGVEVGGDTLAAGTG